MKGWLAPLFVCAALLGAARPTAARDAVRVLALRDALDPGVLDDVGRPLKADVLVDGFATAPEVEAALRGPAAYDVVLLPADAVGRRVKPELLSPLDPAAVPEAAAVLPQLTAAIGSAAHVAVPFDWYPIGFAVNAAKLKDSGLPAGSATGWDVLDKPDLLRRTLACGFGWPVEARDAFDVVAVAVGGTAEALDRRRTLAVLAELRTDAHKGNAAERADGLAEGDLCAAVLPAPDALLAAERAKAAGGADVRFVVPASGGVLAVDGLALPVAGRNHAGALALLRALLRPETVAANARATHVAPAVGRDDAEAAFDPLLLTRLRMPQPPDAALARAAAAAWEHGPSH